MYNPEPEARGARDKVPAASPPSIAERAQGYAITKGKMFYVEQKGENDVNR